MAVSSPLIVLKFSIFSGNFGLYYLSGVFRPVVHAFAQKLSSIYVSTDFLCSLLDAMLLRVIQCDRAFVFQRTFLCFERLRRDLIAHDSGVYVEIEFLAVVCVAGQVSLAFHLTVKVCCHVVCTNSW